MFETRLDLMTDDELVKYATWTIAEIARHESLYQNDAFQLKELLLNIAVELHRRTHPDLTNGG